MNALLLMKRMLYKVFFSFVYKRQYNSFLLKYRIILSKYFKPIIKIIISLFFIFQYEKNVRKDVKDLYIFRVLCYNLYRC